MLLVFGFLDNLFSTYFILEAYQSSCLLKMKEGCIWPVLYIDMLRDDTHYSKYSCVYEMDIKQKVKEEMLLMPEY